MRKIERAGAGVMKPGQDLVVAGYAGFKGTLLLLQEKESFLYRWFSPAYLKMIKMLPVPELNPVPEWLNAIGVTECEQVGEGGIYTALWNLSGGYGRGISFELKKIPLRQETVEICERLELNPYRLLSDHCLVLVADNGGRTVRQLAEQGIPAVVIGYVNDTIKREILHEEGLGYLDRPQPDELWRVLPEPSGEEA